MPTLITPIKSTDIDLQQYTEVGHSFVPYKNALTKYTKDYSKAVVILYHLNRTEHNQSIKQIREYQLTEGRTPIQHGLTSLFRQNETLAYQANYHQGLMHGAEIFLEPDGFHISSIKEFKHNQIISHHTFEYDDSTESFSETTYCNGVKFETFYFEKNSKTPSYKIRFRANGSYQSKIEFNTDGKPSTQTNYSMFSNIPLFTLTFQKDGITPASKTKYRSNGSRDSLTEYKILHSGKVTPSSEIQYLMDGNTPYKRKDYHDNDIIRLSPRLYHSNGIPARTVQYQDIFIQTPYSTTYQANGEPIITLFFDDQESICQSVMHTDHNTNDQENAQTQPQRSNSLFTSLKRRISELITSIRN